MEVIDYNGDGRWSRSAIIQRYGQFAAEAGISPRDLTPNEHTDCNRHWVYPVRRWVYPVMEKVIEGIDAGDVACVRIGIEFMEEDAKFPFGKILKSKTARALRRAPLTDEQKRQIRRRVFGLLRAGHVPHEFRDYAKLVRRIGFEASEIPEVDAANPFAVRFRSYFEAVARRSD